MLLTASSKMINHKLTHVTLIIQPHFLVPASVSFFLLYCYPSNAQTHPLIHWLNLALVASITSTLKGKGISGPASDLILASWRETTESIVHTLAAGEDGNSGAQRRVITQHLHQQSHIGLPGRPIYHQEKQYRTINSYRSAHLIIWGC